MLTLVVQDKEGKSVSQFPLAHHQEVVLGRGMDVHVPLLSKNVSRHHAKIRQQDQEFLIEDLGSANGVFLDGNPIQKPTTLRDGSEIRIGDFVILVAPDEESSRRKNTPSLEGQNSTFQGKTFWLKEGENIVGRGSESDIVVIDGSISRKHASLTLHNHQLSVKDLNSSNGTFVEDKVITGSVSLQHGQTVRFGSLSFLLSLPGTVPVTSSQKPSPEKSFASTEKRKKSPGTQVSSIHWLRLAVVLLTPLSALFLLSVGIYRIASERPKTKTIAQLQSSFDDLTKMLSTVEEKKNQKDWVATDEMLEKILRENPGNAKARNLYVEIHFKAENLRNLTLAKTLLQEQKFQEASKASRKVEDSSELKYEAELLEEEAKRRGLSDFLRKGTRACEQNEYKRCLETLCSYLYQEDKDPDTYRLAQLALLSLAPAKPPACVKNIDEEEFVAPRVFVEKRYQKTPSLIESILLFFDGEGEKAEESLQDLLATTEDASEKSKLEKTYQNISNTNKTLKKLIQRIEDKKISEAERLAKVIWQNEKSLFGTARIQGSSGKQARRALIDAMLEEIATFDPKQADEWKNIKKRLDKLSRLDPYKIDIPRFIAETRFTMDLREAYEVALQAMISNDLETAQKPLKLMLPLLSKGLKFRKAVAERLAELEPAD